MGLTVSGLSVPRALGRRGIKVTGVSPLSSIISKRLPATYSRFLTYVQEPKTESESERLNFATMNQKKAAQKIRSDIRVLASLLLDRLTNNFVE